MTEPDPERTVLPAAVPSAGEPGGPGASSFGELYLGSFAAMVRLARVLIESPDTAEDLVQDAFVHLHRHWGGVRDPRAYLHRSVVNACRSHHRRSWRERTRGPRADAALRGTEPRSGFGPDQPGSVVDGAAEQGRFDDADVLGAALATLPYRQRAALVLRYYSDLPDAEIAVALGCRPGTVGSLVHRGLERLREVVDHA
ncbi:MAG TPA: RNA polymerase sigma factor [Acidimicrobiales bacterium]|nr:RNA polymerase sigma factor [Acidimicrobiales bacterium]